MNTSGADDLRHDDYDRDLVDSFPLMAFFDRVGPQPHQNDGQHRWEVLRRGGRDLNASQLVASGRLVILAEASESPLPLPLDVNGDRTPGEGLTLYEIALPLDRSALDKVEAKERAAAAAAAAAAAPATKPATAPAGGP